MLRAMSKDASPVWTSKNLTDPHRVGDKADRVRQMFDAVAPTYQLINTLASAGRDAAWRRRGVALARVERTDDVLDVACGTGDFARAFADHRPSPRSVIGADFSQGMLELAAAQTPTAVRWCRADAQTLPLTDESVSVVSCAFGIRNFQNLSAGLAEMARVLRPGGRAIILEFSTPRSPVWKWLYRLYLLHIMPMLATLVSRDRTGAYRYLPRSVLSFASDATIVEALHEAGFASVTTDRFSAGIVTAYRAEVAS